MPTKAEEKKIINEMDEVASLLKEFGAQLSGYQPGVSANIIKDNRVLPGHGYWGETLSFDRNEWLWLRPLLEELKGHRDKAKQPKRSKEEEFQHNLDTLRCSARP